MKKVVVLGSYHTCYFFNGDRIPGKGETVIGNDYFVSGGGKASNQAVVCSILGGDCTLIQNLGDDDFGRKAKDTFVSYGLDPKFIRLKEGMNTGIAPIIIDKNGENAIMVIPGAHGKYSIEDIDEAEQEIKDSFIAGFALETNYDMTEYMIKKAHGYGVQTFLDPAPVMEFDPSLYQYLTYIKPNEHEASLLTGIEVTDYDSAVKAGRWFLEKGTKYAIITLGGSGCVLVTDGVEKSFQTPKVKVVDTTAAGDTFAGSFMYALASDMPIDDAIIFASCSASLSVTKPGAMESVASPETVREFVEEFKKTL